MILATIRYRKDYQIPAREVFAGIFENAHEAEGYVKSAFYGYYKNGIVITDGGGKLHLTEISSAVNIPGSLAEVTGRPYTVEGN